MPGPDGWLMGARVLLVGSGAREHAVAWKLRQSPDVDAVVVAPGNGGTSLVADNVPVQPKDIDGLVAAAKQHGVDFYLATMDDPQPLGLVDRLQAAGLPCYGPTAAASQLEASKAFAKAFMTRHSIPTARFQSFTDHTAAVRYVESFAGKPVVVKASGLAAGKGARVCDDEAQALDALHRVMVAREFGAAGDEVVVEERLTGWETSAHAFCDGETALLMPFASDYKRAGDGDTGLNTGGIGAYSPSARVDEKLTALVRTLVVEPTMAGMRAEGRPFAGTLYPGIMVTPDGIRVLEYNARLGDPETQVLVPRLESDLFAICRAAAERRLGGMAVRWSAEPAVGVVLASGGYPGPYSTGYPIDGLDAVDDDALVFHAGTKRTAAGFVTSGGRVLTVVARGQTIAEARARAYDNARRIHFEDVHYRQDIAGGL